MINRQIAEAIVAQLARKQLPASGEKGVADRNPWRYNAHIKGETQEAALIRRKNLERFLNVNHVNVFLIADFGLDADVGETGIPMVSPSCIAAGRIPRTSVESLPQSIDAIRESVAINDIWRVLYEHGVDSSTITWNLYPYVSTIRRQPDDELVIECASILEPMLALHPRAQIIATNTTAANSLKAAVPSVAERVIDLRAQRSAVGALLSATMRSLHLVT